METYYTKKEFNEMKNALTRKIKALEKKLAKQQEHNSELKAKIKELTTPSEDNLL